MKRSYFYALLTILLWGSSAAISKMLLSRLNDFQILLYVSLFAMIGLFLIVLFQKKLHLIRNYTIKDYITFSYMGFIGMYLYQIFFLKAMFYLPAQEAFIINYLWPVMVVIFASLILKEKVTLKKFAGIILSFAGVFLVACKGDIFTIKFDNTIGILYALMAAISYGIFSVLGKKLKYEEFVSMMFYYLFTFIYSLITVLATSVIPKVSLFQISGLLWYGIFVSGLAYVFWFLALKYGDTAKMSNIVFLTPFVSLIYIYLLLGEKILLTSFIGLLIIVSGMLVQSIRIPNRKDKGVASLID